MLPRARDWRPLPDEIVIVAYPDAFPPTLTQSSPETHGSFFIIMAPPEDIRITAPLQAWLKLAPPTRIGSDFCRVGYAATTNPQQPRQQEISIAVRTRNYLVRFRQAGGELTQKEMLGLLNAPLSLDFLVAITYAASLIKKVQPPPVKLIVIIGALLSIVALGFAIATIRHLFINVPAPPPLSTDTQDTPIILFPGATAPIGLLPLAGVAVEDQVIALQTLHQLYWLLKQVQ